MPSPIGPTGLGGYTPGSTSSGFVLPGMARSSGRGGAASPSGATGPSGAGPGAGMTRAPTVDYSAMLKAFAPTTPAPIEPMVNTSTPNPTITAVNQAQLKDFQGDMNVGNLSRASDIEIRDAAENERKAARQNAAARGVSSGGVEDIQQAGITSSVLSNQSKARVALKNEGEARRAGLGGQIAGQAAMDENLQNQQRNTGINQQSMQFQQQQAIRDSDLARFGKVLDFFASPTLFA